MYLAEFGKSLHRLEMLHGITLLLSNLVSNVPAIMLLLPIASSKDGIILALPGTFAGNLLVIGSIANIIVMDAAARRDVSIRWKQHALAGIPVTLLALGFAAGYPFALEGTERIGNSEDRTK